MKNTALRGTNDSDRVILSRAVVGLMVSATVLMCAVLGTYAYIAYLGIEALRKYVGE